MTIKHLTADELASYYVGEAMRRKIDAGTNGDGPLGIEISLITQWVVRWLAASELAVVEAAAVVIRPHDIIMDEIDGPTRPELTRLPAF